jgi:hypothetical protein
VLLNGAVLTHGGTTSSTVKKLDILVTGTLQIDATSRIDVSGRGFLGGGQPGNPSPTNGMTLGFQAVNGSGNGASYGGLGGIFSGNTTRFTEILGIRMTWVVVAAPSVGIREVTEVGWFVLWRRRLHSMERFEPTEVGLMDLVQVEAEAEYGLMPERCLERGRSARTGVRLHRREEAEEVEGESLFIIRMQRLSILEMLPLLAGHLVAVQPMAAPGRSIYRVRAERAES